MKNVATGKQNYYSLSKIVSLKFFWEKFKEENEGFKKLELA